MMTNRFDNRGGKPGDERAHLDDLRSMARQNGYALVPIKPGSDMLIAGAVAGESDVATVWTIYQAMINAA